MGNVIVNIFLNCVMHGVSVSLLFWYRKRYLTGDAIGRNVYSKIEKSSVFPIGGFLNQIFTISRTLSLNYLMLDVKQWRAYMNSNLFI